jgi:hypothetical protein
MFEIPKGTENCLKNDVVGRLKSETPAPRLMRANFRSKDVDIRFFYKYRPLSNRIVKNDPAENYCHFWPGGYTEKRHVSLSANGCGGQNFPP